MEQEESTLNNENSYSFGESAKKSSGVETKMTFYNADGIDKDDESSNSSDDMLLQSPIAVRVSSKTNNSKENSSFPMKYNLDTLLADMEDTANLQKIDESLKNSETKQINQLMTDNLKKNELAMLDDLNETNFKIFSDKKDTDHIADAPPGCVIFKEFDRESLLQFSNSLTLKSCGLKKSQTPSFINQFLNEISTDQLKDLLSSKLLQNHFQNLFLESNNCQSICRYMIYMISITDDILLIEEFSETLKSIISHAVESKHTDAIPMIDFEMLAPILARMGADLKLICDSMTSLDVSMKQKLLSNLKNSNTEVNDDSHFATNSFPQCNLIQLFELITFLQRHSCGIKDSHELHLILMTIFFLALDVEFQRKDVDLHYSMRKCISALLDCIPLDDLDEQYKLLSLNIQSLDDHHHNLLLITQLCPYSERGLQLQRTICYLLLQNLLKVGNVEHLLDVTPCIILQLLEAYPLKNEDDYYKLNSIIHIIDLSIGNEVKEEHRSDLLKLTTHLKNSLSSIKESALCLDGPRLKYTMVRLTSKWTFLSHNMPHQQKSMFNYFSSS